MVPYITFAPDHGFAKFYNDRFYSTDVKAYKQTNFRIYNLSKKFNPSDVVSRKRTDAYAYIFQILLVTHRQTVHRYLHDILVAIKDFRYYSTSIYLPVHLKFKSCLLSDCRLTFTIQTNK